MEGKIVIVSGPSGVGKDTVIDAWIAQNPRVQRVITCTSRQPRDGEVNGVHYHFFTPEEMQAKEAAGDFYEMKNVHGNFYATPKKGVQDILDAGGIAVLRIDTQGAIELMPKMPHAVTVFIDPPSFEELERRIRSRALDSEEVIQTRLKNARNEIACSLRYRHIVTNDVVEHAVRKLEYIIAPKVTA